MPFPKYKFIFMSYGWFAIAASANISLAFNPFQYAGQYSDYESGLQYLKARYYCSALSRFLSVDSYSQDQKTWFDNTYNYAGGNPVSNVDPSGHMLLPSPTVEWTGKEFVEAPMEIITNINSIDSLFETRLEDLEFLESLKKNFANAQKADNLPNLTPRTLAVTDKILQEAVGIPTPVAVKTYGQIEKETDKFYYVKANGRTFSLLHNNEISFNIGTIDQQRLFRINKRIDGDNLRGIMGLKGKVMEANQRELTSLMQTNPTDKEIMRANNATQWAEDAASNVLKRVPRKKLTFDEDIKKTNP